MSLFKKKKVVLKKYFFYDCLRLLRFYSFVKRYFYFIKSLGYYSFNMRGDLSKEMIISIIWEKFVTRLDYS